MIGRVTMPTGQTLSPVNPTSGASIGRSLSLSSLHLLISWKVEYVSRASVVYHHSPSSETCNVNCYYEGIIMRLVGAPGVFFAEGYHLIVEAGILRGFLDDHDIVYLSRICFSQGSGSSSRCWSSCDGPDFPNGPRPVVFSSVPFVLEVSLDDCWRNG
jgi:hypothetical protein